MPSISRKLRFAALVSALFLIAGMPGIAAAASDAVPGDATASANWTDIWWNPAESGWGLQMVHTGTFIYVTIYVYSPAGAPVWYGGGMYATGTPTYAGDLYAATGPYFGGDFNSASVLTRKVGSIMFVPSTPDSGQLTYSVDGVAVTKAIRRQPLTLDDYSGVYVAFITATVSGCLNPEGNGSATGAVAIEVTQSGTAMSLQMADATGFGCIWTGIYSQLGRNGTFESTFTCGGASVDGTTTWSEMDNHLRQLSARISSHNASTACTTTGRIAGLIPD